VSTCRGRGAVGARCTRAASCRVLFDSSGYITNEIADGLVERVVLPDGSLFLSAGRADFIDHPGVIFLLTPDHGTPADVAAFCAALSP
jgi:hypothetical protein